MASALGSVLLTVAFIVAGFGGKWADRASRVLLVGAAVCFLINFWSYL